MRVPLPIRHPGLDPGSMNTTSPGSARPCSWILTFVRMTAEVGCGRSGRLEQLLHAARGLPEALLVLDQGDPDIAFAFLAESDAWGDRDMGFGEQALGELHRAEGAERFRDRRPGEH